MGILEDFSTEDKAFRHFLTVGKATSGRNEDLIPRDMSKALKASLLMRAARERGLCEKTIGT